MKVYSQSKCAVLVNGKVTEWFDVCTGVRQGCLLSPTLFNLFLEFVMGDIKQLDSGMQMGDMHINNIRYADDTTLLDLMLEKLQMSTQKLEEACKAWGMKINVSKCRVMTNDQQNIILDGTTIEKADNFIFLGSNIPSVEVDVKRRTRLAAWAFGRLKNNIWSNQNITRSLKVRIYRALILPIATYGAETWTLRKADISRLESFEMRCLRSIAGVHLLDRIRSKDIRNSLHIKNSITEEITKRRMKWFGHVIRMPDHRLPRKAYLNNFTKTRPPGRPLPLRWKDQISKVTGSTLPTLENQAKDREGWRAITLRSAKGHTVLSP